MINVFMLAEELDGLVAPGRNSSLALLDLDDVRLYSRFSDEYHANSLYVLTPNSLEEACARSPYSTFAVVGSKAPEVWDGMRDLLILPDSRDAMDAIDRITSIFGRYRAVEAEMTRRAIAGRDVTAILEPVTDLLVNPIVISDLAFGYMARTGVYDPERTDVAWDEVENEGYAASLPMTKSQIRRLEESHEPLRYELDGVRVLQTCIRSNDEPVGFIGATELYGPFTDGQAAITWWVNQELGKLWPLIVRNSRDDIQSEMDFTEQTVMRVIERMPTGASSVTRMLSFRSWKVEDAYRLLCFHRRGVDLTEYEAAKASKALSRLFPDGIVIAYGGAVLVVLHGEDAGTDLAADAIHRTLERNGLCCAASTVERGFMHLDRLWEQCRIVRDVTDASDAHAGTVTELHDALPSHLLGVVAGADDLETLIHPQVASLARRPRGEDFVHSLRVYLACGRSMSRAARELYVHRSTLVYRIEQIERELGFPLDEASENMLLHLYLSCMILEERKG